MISTLNYKCAPPPGNQGSEEEILNTQKMHKKYEFVGNKIVWHGYFPVVVIQLRQIFFY